MSRRTHFIDLKPMFNPLLTATTPRIVPSSAQGRAWQQEIQTYYQNYYLLELVLAKGLGLPTHLTIRYTTLQRHMVTALETLLTEDERRPQSTPSDASITGFYRRHTQVLRQINQQVSQLLTTTHGE